MPLFFWLAACTSCARRPAPAACILYLCLCTLLPACRSWMKQWWRWAARRCTCSNSSSQQRRVALEWRGGWACGGAIRQGPGMWHSRPQGARLLTSLVPCPTSAGQLGCPWPMPCPQVRQLLTATTSGLDKKLAQVGCWLVFAPAWPHHRPSRKLFGPRLTRMACKGHTHRGVEAGFVPCACRRAGVPARAEAPGCHLALLG